MKHPSPSFEGQSALLSWDNPVDQTGSPAGSNLSRLLGSKGFLEIQMYCTGTHSDG